MRTTWSFSLLIAGLLLLPCSSLAGNSASANGLDSAIPMLQSPSSTPEEPSIQTTPRRPPASGKSQTAASLAQQFASRSVEKSIDDTFGEPPVEEPVGLDALLAALEDPEWKVRWDAVNALGNSKDRRATPALVKRALRDDNPHPRWRSLWALSAVDPGGRDAIPLLRDGLENPDAVVVRNAAVALAFFAQPEAKPELLKALKDPDVFRRWEAVFSLKTIGDEHVVRALIPLLNESIEPAVRVRQETALTLGRIGKAEVVPALLGSLREDQSPQVRWRAAMALSKIGAPQLADTLERVLDNEQDPQVRKSVEDAVRTLRNR